MHAFFPKPFILSIYFILCYYYRQEIINTFRAASCTLHSELSVQAIWNFRYLNGNFENFFL